MNSKYFVHLLLVICTIITISCQNQTIKPTPKITSSDVLHNVQKAMDPNDEFRNSKSIMYRLNHLIINNRNSNRIVEEDTFYYRYPEKYKLQTNLKVTQTGSVTFKKKDLILNNGVLSKTIDGKKVDLENLSKNRQNAIKKMLYDYRNYMTFGIFSELYELSLSSRTYSCEGYICYRLSATLKNSFEDGSGRLTYFIDNQQFLIRKVESKYSVVSKIKYKTFDNVKFPAYYILTKIGPQQIRQINSVLDVKINPVFKEDFFLGEK